MIRAFGRAFAQLFDARILRIVALSLVTTIAVYAALIGALIWTLSHIELATTPWLDSLARWGTGFAAVLLATLVFPAAVTAVMALWQERISEAVDARYYPGLAPARAVPVAEVMGAGLRLLALTVLLNLALLPLYLALIFIPPMNALVFAGVNGLLLGREYFDAAALRRMSADEAAILRRRWRRTVWLAGTLAALALTIPGLNLVGPVLATAAFVHLVQDLRGRSPGLSYSKN
jgi:uncharacterized protein involved in cysteine biosynthesis